MHIMSYPASQRKKSRNKREKCGNFMKSFLQFLFSKNNLNTFDVLSFIALNTFGE